jgi:ArsR family metal-binding transcriptional regulator
MSRSWNKAWKNTPRINCGLCGISTCASFARAICAGFLSIDACPILHLPVFENQRRALEEYLKQIQPVRMKTAPKLPDGGVLLTRPCKDTDEKVMAEMRVYNGVDAGSPMHFSVFDSTTLCDILECFSTKFDLVKCSRDLGYARADLGDRNITILQDGRINMRRITDKEQAESLFYDIERSIIGAVICNCCGADLLSILTGSVISAQGTHTVLEAGSTFKLDRKIAGQTINRQQMLTPEIDEIQEIVEVIDGLGDFLKFNIDKLLQFESKGVDEYPDIETVRCMLVNSLFNRKISEYEIYLLKTLAIVWAIDNAILGLQEFKEELNSIDSSHKNHLLDYLKSARNGTLIPTEETEPELLLGFANAVRINKAIFLLKQWSE